MSKELNEILKKAYNRYKDVKNPPISLKPIKEYLETEGVELDVQSNK